MITFWKSRTKNALKVIHQNKIPSNDSENSFTVFAYNKRERAKILDKYCVDRGIQTFAVTRTSFEMCFH